MLAARVASPRHTRLAASSVAMATAPAISCMPGKTGLSEVPSPYAASGAPRCTAAT